MKLFRNLGAGLAMMVAAVSLAACSTVSDIATELSPRERTVDLVARYAVMQEVALAAVQSPNVDAETRRSIRAADSIAVAAIEQYASVTRGCRRDPDGDIVLELAEQCEPNTARQIFPTANAALMALQRALTPLAEEN